MESKDEQLFSESTPASTQGAQPLLALDGEETHVDEIAEQSESARTSTTASPDRLSTLRLAGEAVFAQQGYSSSNPWEADDDEFNDHLKGLQVTPTRTMREYPFRSVRVSPFTLRNNLHAGQEGKDSMADTSKLSPTQTPQRVALSASKRRSPAQSTGRGSGGVAGGMWDPDEDEFDRWPGQETLNRIAMTFKQHRGTYKRTDPSFKATTATSKDVDGSVLVIESDDSSTIPPIRGANLTAQQHEDLTHELQDKECGNPNGSDAHDEVMRQFYSPQCQKLPASLPARHMHIIDYESFISCKDTIVKCAMPRLCDAVATVLYLSCLKCLDDFMSSEVKIFEWRRDGNCVMIRREGNEVIVGTYRNFGTRYVWTYFVRSNVSDTGAWTETYAAVALSTTPTSAAGVDFAKFESESSAHGISPTDPKYALFKGRDLAFFLLNNQVWSYRWRSRWTVSWEADGVVTIPKEHDRYQLGKVVEQGE